MPPLDEETEKRMKQEHFDKYDKLSRYIGITYLSSIILTKIPKEKLVKAIDAKDEYLNSITLETWDTLAGKKKWVGTREPLLNRVEPSNLWFIPKEIKDGQLSLSERVCVLKHVAKYYIATNFGSIFDSKL